MSNVSYEQQTLRFSGDLQLQTVSEALKHVQGYTLQSPLTLDLSQVGQVDTSAISLILELQRQLHAQHPQDATVVLQGVPDNLRSLMHLYGVDAFLLN